MRQLPTGSVTFLFTDVEGSTRLLYELGGAYAGALADHRRALREVFAAHGGVEVDTQGDAFFVAFGRAADALAAAAAGQAALVRGPIRVRMGLHTGEPIVTEEGYVGLDVHRASRIAAAGHGGQVVVSRTTRELVAEELRELGEHRLKDFSEPVALFQLGDGFFPPLKTISNTNLPRPASSFVGREREVADVVAQLRDRTRLLTLTGPGGSGKTRLAVEAAGELVPEFKAGVFWIALAAIRDPALVAGAVARTIGAREALADHIADRDLLLVLDNLEQVIEAAPELATLVEACPNLRLLVTSRERLRVRGEVEYSVEPLAAPDAVALFCARARTEPDPTVADLCSALDNLPLALELAAARSTLLSSAQILERLSERLDLFKGGRDADPRQRTLRATIEWSYDLLDVEELRLFARLAVFRHDCSLEAAEAVAAARFDTLQSLVDKGLVRQTAERFWMLETIREFAAERFRESGELAETCAAHAEHFRVFADDIGAELGAAYASETLARVEQDLENIRDAFRWNTNRGRIEAALTIFVSLEQFWSARGCPEDFLASVDSAVGSDGTSIDKELRAKALWVAGFQAARAREFARPERLLRKSVELFRELGKGYETVRGLGELAVIEQEQGREEDAKELAEQALGLARDLDDARAVSAASTCLATIAYWRDDFARAADLYEEALFVDRQARARLGPIASNLYNVGLCARALEDWDRAGTALRESLEVATQSGHAVLIGNAATGLGYVALARGELGAARSWMRQGLEVLAEVANAAWTASAFNLAAALSVAAGDDSFAGQLWGASDALIGDASLLEVPDARVRDKFQAEARYRLGEQEFAAMVTTGARLAVAEAVQVVMAVATESR
jgi:predicted ATPase